MAEKSGVNELTVRPPPDGADVVGGAVDPGLVVAGGVVVGDVVFLLELQAEANSPMLRARERPPTFINLRCSTPFLLNDGALSGRCRCHNIRNSPTMSRAAADIFSRCPPGA
jgi:hypothetical protein